MDNLENLRQRLDAYIAEKLAELESSPRGNTPVALGACIISPVI